MMVRQMDDGIDVTESEAERGAAVISALASSPRFLMIKIMLEGEVLVGDLADRIGLSQSATSQHLAKFKKTGMISQRRYRQFRYCVITPSWSKMLQKLVSTAEAQPAIKAGPSPRR